MIKRWAILGVLLLLLPLCAAGWWRSVGREAGIERYFSADSSYFSFGTRNGMLFAHWGKYMEPQDADGWYSYDYPTELQPFVRIVTMNNYLYCLGFEVEHFSDPGGHSAFSSVAVPYWLVMLLSGMGIYIVWRKIRARTRTGHAFPMVLEADGKQSRAYAGNDAHYFLRKS